MGPPVSNGGSKIYWNYPTGLRYRYSRELVFDLNFGILLRLNFSPAFFYLFIYLNIATFCLNISFVNWLSSFGFKWGKKRSNLETGLFTICNTLFSDQFEEESVIFLSLITGELRIRLIWEGDDLVTSLAKISVVNSVKRFLLLWVPGYSELSPNRRSIVRKLVSVRVHIQYLGRSVGAAS